ncbi:MAG: bifunctional endoribonuclease/protein kinase ire1 [Thelocarpon superellum]|nr:MAG: bifunctional endoribonuclease/protein kinase ire1 [Thelocarpon superellum]
MTPRPPGPARLVTSAVVLLCLLPLLGTAAQQQPVPSAHHAQAPSRPEAHTPSAPGHVLPSIGVETPRRRSVEPVRKALKDTVVADGSDDASAITTLAPASLHTAVRAPPDRSTVKPAGLSSLLNARSLQDWEVEDFVLLATVDGTIHARDRKTGAPRWALEVDRPMVETTYHRHNRSAGGAYRPEDDFLWIVEPNRDGSLYIYTPGPDPALQELGLTVKKLVEELSPYAGEDPPVVYTAEKKNTLYTVDAGTGRVLKMFSSTGSSVNDDRSCRRVSGLEMPTDDECGSSGTLTLGRVEYTVGIQSRETGDPICTLKYSEWTPNNRDLDLQNQYSSTLDQKYVYSRHDGSIFGFDHAQMDERRRLYTQKFSSPVARVFDIARPANTEARDAPLVILPQPTGPTDEDELASSFRDRDNRIFINCTESGGWYAMSESTYPLVTGGAAQAQCYNPEWRQTVPTWEAINPAQRRLALVGVHSIASYAPRNANLPTISGPSEALGADVPLRLAQEPLPSPSPLAIGSSRLLGYAAQNAVDIGLILPLILLVLFVYVNRRKFSRMVSKSLDVDKIPGVKGAFLSAPPTPAVPGESFRTSSLDLSSNTPDGDGSADLASEAKESQSPDSRAESTPPEEGSADAAAAAVQVPAKKKKTHRGQRGGAGRKKTRKDSIRDVEKDNIDRIVDEVKEIGRDPSLEPDVIKVNGVNGSEITDVSGPFKVNNLVVTDTVLGYGSHGTIVYRGSFEGREVAVKRMLLEFYDVASHEVSLLQESDDHPNVIRYFCRQQSAGFLYIALELCPASLQDVVEKPHEYATLAEASLLDLPNVLYQIAAGVRYLHSLKIVHRDLKPQNILVATPKKPRNDPNAALPPRLLISDFGLCKKLDGDQSSFRATTAHAAGTSGWRAPELLVDDEANPQGWQGPSNGETLHSGDASEPAIIDTLSNRRATRAIDIFSLGCVFFYILSRGGHPFGDRYMREANIVKGHYNLDQLQALADYGYEAAALIERMLDHSPRDRPDATTVMIHPFFWSAEKRLNFLVDVSDHFEWEPRDPPSAHLQVLEGTAPEVLGVDFLRKLDKAFIDTLGKQRKYTGSKILDLLRALRNKKNHYQDMPEHVKAHVGPLPHGYLSYWTTKFPMLLLQCYFVVVECRLEELPRFRLYFAPPA